MRADSGIRLPASAIFAARRLHRRAVGCGNLAVLSQEQRMAMDGQNRQDAAQAPAAPITRAERKTRAIRKKLLVAGAELHLTGAALERHLPKEVKRGDVAHALAQRGTIEHKVQQAADELSVVNGLLDEEVAERVRLEKELAAARRKPS
jgi:hypothetical protein